MKKILYLKHREEFAACHRLCVNGLSDIENENLFGKCANPNWHGHTYVLIVTVGGTVDPMTGLVMDLRELKRLIRKTIIADVDHKNLNLDVPWLSGIVPTAENLCVTFRQRLIPELPPNVCFTEIELWESDNNAVIYKGEEKE